MGDGSPQRGSEAEPGGSLGAIGNFPKPPEADDILKTRCSAIAETALQGAL